MGGGALSPSSGHLRYSGLSPRGRGSHIIAFLEKRIVRSIPAWAGEPSILPRPERLPRVYPRVGGGAFSANRRRFRLRGLSPRGRGSPKPRQQSLGSQRSIPAWAGEPAPQSKSQRQSKVYPRVGGGARFIVPLGPPKSGLSPRGRGSHRIRSQNRLDKRSIPAWAGEPRRLAARRAIYAVYPRVGGGARPKPRFIRTLTGLSPRGRGSHHRDLNAMRAPRSIPAWAGEPQY